MRYINYQESSQYNDEGFDLVREVFFEARDSVWCLEIHMDVRDVRDYESRGNTDPTFDTYLHRLIPHENGPEIVEGQRYEKSWEEDDGDYFTLQTKHSDWVTAIAKQDFEPMLALLAL